METWSLRVVSILPEALDTKTILLEHTDEASFHYQAGQFLTLLFQSHGRELRRSYSFSTTPGVDPVPAITVKRIPNGEISRYLLDQLKPGDTLTSLPPAGRFTLEPAQRLYFIAAGSGLVPIFSLIKKAVITQARVTLITQQHEPSSTPFRKQLEKLQNSYGPDKFEWIDLLSIHNGRINNWWLERWLETTGAISGGTDSIPGIGDTRFYLCGPAPFMRMAQYTLRTLGIPDARIRQEHFTVERRPVPPLIDAAPHQVHLQSAQGDYSFETAWPNTILDAALKQGIRLPYSCRAGRCSTCVAKVIRGQIKMSTNEVLTEEDLQAGLILTCVGYAETDVTISYAPSPTPNA